MKRIPVISLVLLFINTGLLIYLVCKIYLLPTANNFQPQQLISGQNFADPIKSDMQAEGFVKAFQKILDPTENPKGIISWPRDPTGKLIKSWEIEFENVSKILEVMKNEHSDANSVYLRLYPVINDKNMFSIMIAGQYKKGNTKYLLRTMKDPSGSNKEIVAPMYEWLEPCPPFDCPEHDF